MKQLISLICILTLSCASVFAEEAKKAEDVKPAEVKKTEAAAETAEKPMPAVSEAEARKATEAPLIEIFDIGQTVLKMALHEGVSPDDAIQSMLSKASERNMKIVGQQNVSKEVENRGIKTPRLEIFQFCNPEDAVKMVAFNPIYAAYMPCRIALVEDSKEPNKYWLMMLNLDMLINSIPLPDELRGIAITVNGTMLEIITAGATGEL